MAMVREKVILKLSAALRFLNKFVSSLSEFYYASLV